MKEIGQREIITLRTPITGRQIERTGPHEPRLFQLNNSMYSIFSTGTQYGWISGVWDYQNQRHFFPEFQKLVIKKKEENPELQRVRIRSKRRKHQEPERISEKNWTPLVIKDEFYFVRHLDPLQIVKCKIHQSCEFVQNNTDALGYEMVDEKVPLRGGTSFELYRYPYYVGIAHGTYFNSPKERYYKTHLVVICVEPFKILYVSDPLKINPDLYQMFKGEKVWHVVQGHFIFPTGLLVENEDSIVIGAHINDIASILLRLEGMRDIVEDVIKEVEGSAMSPNPDLSIQKYLLERAQVINVVGNPN